VREFGPLLVATDDGGLAVAGTPPSSDDARELTIAEVAERLRVHRKTVERYLKTGRLPGAYRLAGGAGPWRIPVSALDAIKQEGQP
jgi:excisionase family DNA binding protein